MQRLSEWLTELRNGAGVARRIPGLEARQRAQWFAAAIRLPFAARRKAPAYLAVPTRLPDGTMIDFRVAHPTDLSVIYEVLYKGQYTQPELEEPGLIVDVGSHIGTSVAWFASRYPCCRVVGLEASPSTYDTLRHNVNAFSNVEVHNVALGARDGEAAFFEHATPWTSSLRASEHARSHDIVPVLTLDSALGLAGPGNADLLKLDIEGAEYEVLRACRPDPRRVHRIVGEIHTWMDHLPFTHEEFLELLDGYEVEEDESGGDHVFRATPRHDASLLAPRETAESRPQYREWPD